MRKQSFGWQVSRFSSVVPLAVSMFFVPAPRVSQADEAVQREEARLLATDRSCAEAAGKGAVRRLMSVWADDAINYFPGHAKAVGKRAIGQLISKNRSQPGFALKRTPETAVVSSSKDIGYTQGTLEVTISDSDGKPVKRNGYYVCIWKKHKDNSWKCSVAMGNFRNSELNESDE